MKKVAILLRGAVSYKSGKIKKISNPVGVENYVNFLATQKSIQKHIVNVNKDYTFDFYIHSWSYDLKNELNELYKPVNFLYEKNSDYLDLINGKVNLFKDDSFMFAQTSQALAISKVSNLFNDYVNKHNLNYEYVIFYRPDIMLWKDIDLNLYDKNKIYSNNHGDGDGDFHFILSQKNIKCFQMLFDSINIENPPIIHSFIKKSIKKTCDIDLISDDIKPGRDQEATRKLGTQKNTDFLIEYGLSPKDISSYSID
jgi:hypothetical protein